jgi:hypothetical protein
LGNTNYQNECGEINRKFTAEVTSVCVRKISDKEISIKVFLKREGKKEFSVISDHHRIPIVGSKVNCKEVLTSSHPRFSYTNLTCIITTGY